MLINILEDFFNLKNGIQGWKYKNINLSFVGGEDERQRNLIGRFAHLFQPF